ncbi:FAS1 domain-containing protein [Chaetomium strumarium]|uniref:FAS1 domain-containing protein n=1 Tax=Chaetomium strumarium TaxID=1170767 RepID=A0AAJ0H133_9PEZI|nr:FAS1 domain-containing protein [Chaetomium strumarium]
MLRQHLIGFLALFAVSALGQSLITVLEENGFTEYAALIQGEPLVAASSDLIIYAPTNAALLADNGTLARRATDRDLQKAKTQFNTVNRTAPKPRRPPTNKPPPAGGNGTRPVRHRDELVPSGSAFVTLLDDPEFANLGPGVNQSIVEKRATASELPVVFSGLGAAVQVTGNDIPFDNGIIRPVNGLFTLPARASETLPFLGVDNFLAALNQTGVLAELDARTGPITILAPDDKAFTFTTSTTNSTGSSTLTRDQLTALVKQHVLVDYLAYTPLLQDGDVYPTLAGGQVAVSVDGKGAVYLDGARILAGDAVITNGAVHTISKVLGAPAPPAPPATGAANSIIGQSWKALVGSAVGIMVAVAAAF